ncbi:MAG: hypothetical protein ACRDZX_07820 [Acidimicrobiales bacterium]
MSLKYVTNMAIALFGGFIVVESLTFSHPAERWVAFAFAIAVVGISLAVGLDRSRGLVQRGLDVLLTGAAGTMIAIAVIFSGMTAEWIVFALALGWVSTSVLGLSVHEVASWRAVHGMAELRPFARAPRLRSQTTASQPAVGSRIAS